MKQNILSNSQYDGLTTTTSTITTRPIASAAPSPPLSPKRKHEENGDLEHLIKKPKMSCTESTVEPESPLYKNFGNGLSVCNNTKTNRFANINEVLRYLSFDTSIESKNSTTTTNCNGDNCEDIHEKTLSEDILNEFIEDLHETKELPELHLNLWDLRDMLRLDFDLL